MPIRTTLLTVGMMALGGLLGYAAALVTAGALLGWLTGSGRFSFDVRKRPALIH
jgi:hypothetical protein